MKKSHVRLLIIAVAIIGIYRISDVDSVNVARENSQIDFQTVQESMESGYNKVAPFIHSVKEVIERVSGLQIERIPKKRLLKASL